MIYQRTISESVGCQGVGLHSGQKIHLNLHPAPEDNGIVFVRSDLAKSKPLKATAENVVSTNFATTLGNGEFCISTVEHLMSAFAGLGIDNAVVELDGDEIPIMDGSALPFVYLIRTAGIKQQRRRRKYIVISRSLEVSEGDKRLSIHPSREFRVSYTIDYQHPAIQTQDIRFTFSGDHYEREISLARTFGFLEEISTLKANGFAAGGSLDNAVVLGSQAVLNSEGLRCPDEFVRHKVLDTIGDLYLLGMPIIGHLVARKAGHRLNHRLVTRVLEDPKRWKVVEFSGKRSESPELGFTVVPAVAAAH